MNNRQVLHNKEMQRTRNPMKVYPTWDFPGVAVVKNSPAKAGDTGLSPGPEDPTCHEQLSLCTTTTEPVLSNK